MFNWNQTTVLNSKLDLNGKDKFTVVSDKKDSSKKGISIAKYATFWKDNVVGAFKRVSEAAAPGSVTFAIPADATVEGEIYRIKLYVRLSGNNNSYYANALTFKGKPFVFEFVGGESGSEIADKCKAILAAYDDPFLKITGEGNNITFTGDNYTLFTEAKVEHFVEQGKNINGGIWEDAGVAAPTKVAPVNGFGTYMQVTKDLRLPTMEARAFAALNAEEMPIEGATYAQVTIVYCADRGVQGLQAIGEPVKSQTVHSFYVREGEVLTALEAALTSAGITVEVVENKEA